MSLASQMSILGRRPSRIASATDMVYIDDTGLLGLGARQRSLRRDRVRESWGWCGFQSRDEVRTWMLGILPGRRG